MTIYDLTLVQLLLLKLLASCIGGVSFNGKPKSLQLLPMLSEAPSSFSLLELGSIIVLTVLATGGEMMGNLIKFAGMLELGSLIVLGKAKFLPPSEPSG